MTAITTPETSLVNLIDGKPKSFTLISADECFGICDAISRALEKLDAKSLTAKRLVDLYDLFWTWMCDFRTAEGPEPTASPLRKDPA